MFVMHLHMFELELKILIFFINFNHRYKMLDLVDVVVMETKHGFLFISANKNTFELNRHFLICKHTDLIKEKNNWMQQYVTINK